MRNLIFILFGILAAAQWYVSGSMITAQEKILEKGTKVKFETAPIDPVDPFRGNYVALSFKENVFHQQKNSQFNDDDQVYVLLAINNNNYATIAGLSKTKPAKDKLYVEATVNYVNSEDNEDLIYLNYSFDKFFMEEFKAPKAERVYRESRIDSTQKAYALVSILDGRAVINNVYINDTAIVDLVKKAK